MKLLVEQVMSLNAISHDLQSISKPLQQHLIKLYIWRDMTTTADYWKKETSRFILEIPLIKSSKKYPSKDFIYNKLFGEWEDVFINHLNRTIQNIVDDYEEMLEINIETIKAEDLLNFIKEYCYWLAENLSKYGDVVASEARDKLTQLLQKYPL